jgi:hypothetical protein
MRDRVRQRTVVNRVTDACTPLRGARHSARKERHNTCLRRDPAWVLRPLQGVV